MNQTRFRDSNGCEDETLEAALVSVVDDDDLMRRSLCRLIHSSGLRCEAFATAEEFLRSERLAVTACLLLDVSMPGMDGLELQCRLAKTGWMIPIVFLSARASGEQERLAIRAGAADFLRKPVSKDVLLQAIRAVLAATNNKPRKQS